MDTLNIKTLTDVIRDFDSEVTVNKLSFDLDISYSTFARANRNGSWPRSLTTGAMLNVLTGYCNRYFGGDGKAMADFMLSRFRAQGLETAALEEALRQEGFDGYLSELMAQVQDPQPGGAVARMVPSANIAAAPVDSFPPESTEPSILNTRNVALALPVGVVLLVGVLNVSLTSALSWAIHNLGAFICISVAIALLPAVVGVVVDAPLAWFSYRNENPDTPFTWGAYKHVAKFGAPEGIVAGAGRFNLTWPYLVFQPICNLAGMMCYVALLVAVLELPGFEDFLLSHEWIEYFKVGIVVSYYVAYAVMRDQRQKPLTASLDSLICENPDNYELSRPHVWANIIHLTWTYSLLIVLLLILFAYSVTHFRAYAAPAIFIWPYLQGILFFFFMSVTSYAVKARSTGVGVFLSGVLTESIGFGLLAIVFYLPSVGGLLLCACCAVCLAAAFTWLRSACHGEVGEWFSQVKYARVYTVVITATIVVLLVLGLVTFAFS